MLEKVNADIIASIKVPGDAPHATAPQSAIELELRRIRATLGARLEAAIKSARK